MLLRCLLFLVCLISALSQESRKANPRVPATKPPEVVSKKGAPFTWWATYIAPGKPELTQSRPVGFFEREDNTSARAGAVGMMQIS